VTTNGLARAYQKLTPLERFRLGMAAAMRGDEQEEARLRRAGKIHWCQVTDTLGYSLGIHAALTIGWVIELETAVTYAQFLRSFSDPCEDQPIEHPEDARLDRVVRLTGYTLVVYHEANQAFLTESGIEPTPPDAPYAGLLAEAKRTALSAAEALEIVREHGGPEAQVRTMETALAYLRNIRDERAAVWRSTEE
jgi:hypothetical protein